MATVPWEEERCGSNSDVNRINYDENGRFLGEFNDDEYILVVLRQWRV